MKKAFTIILAVAMLASMACVGASARVLFTDPFDTWLDYWVGSMEEPAGANMPTEINGNNMLEGFANARVHSSRYEDDDDAGVGYKNSLRALVTGTFWIEVYTEITDGEDAGAGFWWKNTYYQKHEGADSADTFTLKYFPATSKVIFARDYPGSTTDEERIIASYDVPGAPGENLNSMTPVILGMRVEAGKISAFVNNTYVASFDDATIGVDACPVLLWNDGLHACWDNYCLGDLEELPLPAPDPNPNPNPNPNPDPNPTPNPNPNPNPTPGPVQSQIVTEIQDVTDDKGNTVTDADGNKVTQVVSEVVTIPSADTNTGAHGNGGAQTGDMAVVVLAVMVVALGSAIVVKKVSSK